VGKARVSGEGKDEKDPIGILGHIEYSMCAFWVIAGVSIVFLLGRLQTVQSERH
jgi:hypothetical protein